MIHSGGSLLPSLLGKIGEVGKNGVQLFFFLSSYLAFVSYEHNVCKNGNEVKCNFIWVIKKFNRLIPLYYICLLIYGVFQGGSVFWLGNEEHISICNVITHIMFMHGFFPHYANSILGVEWYLGTLAVFYVLVPFLYKNICSLENSLMWFCVSGPICWGLSVLGTHYFLPGTVDAYIYKNFWGTLCFITQFPILILGIVLFYFFKSNILKRVEKKKLFSYILLGFSICMVGGMVLGYNEILGMSSFTLFGIWFLMLAVSQKLNSCILIDNKFLEVLGKHSYPIYLFHCFLIWIYEMYFPNSITNNIIVDWLIKYLFIVIVSLAIAIPLDVFNTIIMQKLNALVVSISR